MGTYTEYERTFVAGYNRSLASKTGAVTRKQRAFDKAQLRLTDGGNGGIISKGKKLADTRHFNALNFEIVEDLDSVEEFRMFARERLGIEKIEGIDLLRNGKNAQAMLAKIEQLSNQYGIRYSRISIIDYGSSNTLAETVMSELRLNCQFINRPDALMDILDYWEHTGYIPKECNNVLYVAEHEFYHLLTQDLIDMPQSKISTLVKRAYKDGCEHISTNGKNNGIHEFVADLLAGRILTSKQRALRNKILKLI